MKTTEKKTDKRSAQGGWWHDTVRGWDVWQHRIRMAFHSAMQSLLIAAAIAVAVMAIYTLLFTSSGDRHRTWVYVQSNFWRVASSGGHPVDFVAPDGRKMTASAIQLAENKGINAAADRVESVALVGLLFGFVGGAIFLVYVVRHARKRGEELRQDRIIRGGSIVEASVLAHTLTSENKASNIKIGELPLVAGTENQHILCTGTTGGGKTVTISEFLDTIRTQGERAIIYDRGGVYLSRFFQSGDHILNPLDARSVFWTPWAEIRSPEDAESLAASIVPYSGGKEAKWWEDAARMLLAAALSSVTQHDVAELRRLLMRTQLTELAKLVKDTDAAAIVDEKTDKLALNVRAELAVQIRAMRYLRSPTVTPFSIREWVANENDNSWLFITSRADQHAALRPLLSCWIDTAASAFLSLGEDLDRRRTWIILDEFPTLQRMPKVLEILAEARKFSVAGVLAMQGISQARDIYGLEGARTISQLCNTKVIYRTPDWDDAEWASKILGEAEVEEADESLSYSASDDRDAINLRHSRHPRRVVIPSEIDRLPDLSAYVKLSGAYPVSKVILTHHKWPKVAQPFVAVTPSAGSAKSQTTAADDPISEIFSL